MCNKIVKLSNHAACRKIERGLRNCDICKILKFGDWTPIEENPDRFKVSMDKDLYLIVNKKEKVVISVINNKHIDSADLFKMVKKKDEAMCNAYRQLILKTPASILASILSPVLEADPRRRLARVERRKMAEYSKKVSILGDSCYDDYKIKC